MSNCYWAIIRCSMLTLLSDPLRPPHQCRQCREHVYEPAWRDPSLWLNQHLQIVMVMLVSFSLSLSSSKHSCTCISTFCEVYYGTCLLTHTHTRTHTDLHISRQSQTQQWTEKAPLPQQLWLWPAVSSLCLVDHEGGLPVQHVCIHAFSYIRNIWKPICSHTCNGIFFSLINLHVLNSPP